MTQPPFQPDPAHACAALVRRHDPERHWLAMLAPEPGRAALMALFALNHELAKTREVVSEALLGQIRLQWWRDSLDGLYAGSPRRHEVIDALASAIAAHGLPKPALVGLVDAREQDLAETAPADLAALLGYCRETGGQLFGLGGLCLGVRDGATAEALVRVGTAWALIGLIRAIPFHASQRRVFLPTAVVERVAADLGQVFEMRPHDGLARAVAALAAEAEDLIARARATPGADRTRGLPILLGARLLDGHLRRLNRAGCDVFAGPVQNPPPLRVAGLVWGRAIGRY